MSKHFDAIMIIHVDMDAFYASVEERENPALRGKPLVVAGRPESRGVVAAANYPAREYGVHSAMPTVTAVRKCPELLVIAPRHELYLNISGQIREIFYRYTPVIEPLSLDEAFLDCQGSEKLYGDAEAIGQQIKCDILQELRLIASVGVAPNKFLAKLGSTHGKPDGFTVVKEGRIQLFLDPMPIDRLWGIGKVSNARLKTSGIFTIRDFRLAGRPTVDQLFGNQSEQLWNLAHGRDKRSVNPDNEVKSISQETTFVTDVTQYNVIKSTAMYLTESVCYRLRCANLEGRAITIKIRYKNFRTITRSHSVKHRTHQTHGIWKIVSNLLRGVLRGKSFSIRLLGVGVSGFTDNHEGQVSLFDFEKRIENDKNKSESIDQLSDSIRERFGRNIIQRGRSIIWKP